MAKTAQDGPEITTTMGGFRGATVETKRAIFDALKNNVSFDIDDNSINDMIIKRSVQQDVKAVEDLDAEVERFVSSAIEAGVSNKAAKPLGQWWRAHAVAMRPDNPGQWFKDNFKEIVRAEKERENNLNEYDQSFRMSKKAKAEYAQKMKEVETFVKENNIKQAQNGKSFYFELNGKKYRVSNHTVEASNAGAFNSEGQQVRELYHPDGRDGEVQIFASPTRIIDIYNAIKDGKQVDGRGRVAGEEYNKKGDETPLTDEEKNTIYAYNKIKNLNSKELHTGKQDLITDKDEAKKVLWGLLKRLVL